MPYNVLVVLCVGGWAVAAIGLYCAHFNAKLALRWKSMWSDEAARCQEAIGLTKEALAAIGMAKEAIQPAEGGEG